MNNEFDYNEHAKQLSETLVGMVAHLIEKHDKSILEEMHAQIKKKNAEITKLKEIISKHNGQLQTVVLGDGTRLLSDVYSPEEGWAGIYISEAAAPVKVGEFVDTGAAAGSDLNASFRIVSYNPASFDVIIATAQRAKASMLGFSNVRQRPTATRIHAIVDDVQASLEALRKVRDDWSIGGLRSALNKVCDQLDVAVGQLYQQINSK